MLRALKRLYNLGIYPEWWKLEPMSAEQWRGIDALIAERDPYCRGVRVARPRGQRRRLARGIRAARASTTCRGFAVGRTIFEEPSRRWLAGAIDDDALIREVRAKFEILIDAWRDGARCRSTRTGRPHEHGPPHHGAGAGPLSRGACTPTPAARRRRSSAACSRSSATATSPASARRFIAIATRCRRTARTTSRRWRTPRSLTPRRTCAGG